MTEEKIRSQTKVILEAYTAAVGMNPSPDISDFLKVRAAAISELERMPMFLQTGQAVAEAAPPIQKSAEKQIAAKQVEKETLPIYEPVQQTTVKEIEEFQPTPTFESLDAGFEDVDDIPKQKSAFELLKSIKDPWND